MKKQFGLPLMLASALAFSACSSDDVAENGPKDISALTNGGYVKMNIKLPSRSASAFKANDDFNDGLAAEYKVNDATLILFQGDNEADARFHSAYMLSTGFNTDATTNQVTSTEQLTKSVNGETVGSNLYALVVLNKNNVIKPQADHTLKVNGADFFGNFAELQKTIVGGNVKAFNETGFFMTNAPLANAQGGIVDPAAANITTLVKINNVVYSTEAEAKTKPAADIYVERGVAKVTMHEKTADLTDAVYQTPMNKVSYTIDAWGLDITNNTSYFSRVPSTTWNSLKSDRATSTSYRFIGKTNMEDNAGADATGLFRTYWGEDPNYNTNPASAFNELIPNPTADASKNIANLYNAFGDDNPLYCMENTFNVDNMKQDRSTRVVVRAKLSSASFTDGEDFYTVNGEKATLYSKANLEKMIKKAIFDNTAVQTFITNNGGTASPADITVTLSARANATGEVSVESFDFSIGTTKFADADKAAVLTAVNGQLQHITCYKDGYAYYPIIIKHFGNDDTPWGLDKDNTITGTNIYPTTGAGADANYLGRYGVLRNNWYDLKVNSIRTIGSAVVPSRDDKYDDELNQYISVKINILSWAKRVQKEDL